MADDIQSNININIDTSQALDSIRMLRNEISAFHTQMAKMGAANAAQAANIRQNLVNSINASGQFSANITKIKTTTESFTTALEKNKLSMGEYFRYAAGASRSFGKYFQTEFETINKVARERVKDLQTQYIKLGRDANGAMQAIKIRPLMLDMDNLATKTQIAAQRQQLLNQLLKQGSTNLLNFGKNTQWAGRQLMVGFTVPLTIMGGAAAKAYQQMEEAAIKFKRVYGDMNTTNAETEKMVKNVQQLATEYTKYGIKVQETMSMAADAAAMGKTGADLLQQVASANKLAALGAVDQNKALETTISLTNAFRISSKNLGDTINFLNSVENQTVLNIEDMTTAIPKAAPVIQQLGGDIKDLAFFMTAMKEGGINASEGANAIKSGLASLINPTGKASEMLAGFGINVKKIVESNRGDLKKTVIDFAKALDTLDPLNRAQAIEQMFGKFQFARLSTLFQNITQQGTQASRVLELASTSSLELSMMAQRELKKIEQSPLFQFQKAVADFQSQLAPVGEQFLKAITPIVNFGTKLLEGFNNLNDGVKQFIVNIVGIGGVIGPVLLMSFGLIANAIANVIKGFALVKDIFNRTGKSSLSLGEQVNYMTQEQLQAAAVAASLDQIHSKLKQTFTSEAAAVDMLTKAYERSVAAQRALNVPITPRGPVRKYASGGIISGPGTGTSDSILAMVSNGEAIIPAASVARNTQLVKQLVSGNIPGFKDGMFSKPDRVGSGRSGRIGKSAFTFPLNYRENVSNTSGALNLFDIDPNLENMSYAYAPEILKSSGVSRAAINKEIDAWRAANLDAIDRATDLVNQGIAPAEAFKDLSTKFSRDMKIAGGPVSKFAETAKTMLPELSKDFEQMRTTAKNMGLNPRNAQDNARLLEALPNNLAARSMNTPGNFGAFSKVRGAALQMLGRGASAAASTGVPRFMMGSLMDTKSLAYAIQSTQEHIATTIEQAKNKIKQAAIRVTQKMSNEIVTAVETSTEQKSPSRKAKKAGENIGTGAIQGIQSSIDDAKRAGTQIGTAVATGAVQATGLANASRPGSAPIVIPSTTQSGRKSRRVSSGSNLVWDDASGTYIPEHLMNLPMYGPARPTRMQSMGLHTAGPGSKFSNLFSNISNTTASNLKNMDPRKFQYRMGGAGAIAGLGSMIPGPIGQISGMMSMPLFAASMFPEFTQKMLPKLITGFGRFIPYVGAAVVAFEVFDKAIVPMMKKNADAYAAISETLSVTQTKLDKINSFFGTDAKLSGLRSVVVASSGSSAEQRSVAEQFRQSQEFKDTYSETSNKLKNLSDIEVQRTLQLLGSDLLGQGYPKEAVSAIVDAIRIEAGKESVSINEALFSFDSPESRIAMRKNMNIVLQDVEKISKGLNVNFKNLLNSEFLFSLFGQAENIEKLKSDISSITSYMSALSGQYINGVISLKEFNIENDKLMNGISSLPSPDGLELINRLISQINPNIAQAVAGLEMLGQKTVYNMMLRGVSPSGEQLNVLEYGTPEQQKQQLDYFTDVTNQADSIIEKMNSQQKNVSGINKQVKNLENQEKKINERYDERLKKLQKIKTLNEQVAKSQQGQLTLAEALNRGDVGAAAAAAIELQSTDVQNALDRQQQNLEDSKENALKPLGDKQEKLSNSIDTLSGSIDKLELALQNLKPETVSGVMSPEEFLFGTGKNPYDKDIIGAFKKIKGKKKSAIGGYIAGPGTGTSDSIPAMLSNGEYVIRANAVKKIGVDALDRLNNADRFANGGMVGYKNGGKTKPVAQPGAWSTANITQESLDRAERNRLYKKGGFRGFEAGFNSWTRDLINSPGSGDIIKGLGEFAKLPIIDPILSTLSLPVNILGGSVNSYMNAANRIQKGDWLGALLSGPQSLGDAFASSYGHMFNDTIRKNGKWVNNEYKSQFEVAAQNAINYGYFGSSGNSENAKEMQALARIIGGGGNLAFDPLAYLGGTGALRGVAGVSSKIARGTTSAAKSIKNKIQEARAINTAKKLLGTTSKNKEVSAQMSKLTPSIGFNMREEGLLNFLKEGQYKTIRHGVRSSSSDTIAQRQELEAAMLGIPEDALAERFPAYGFLTTHEPIPATQGTIYPGIDNSHPLSQVLRDKAMKKVNPVATAGMYGDYTVLTKPSVMARSTFSFGDTLSIFSGFKNLKLKIPKASKFTSVFNSKTGLSTESDFIKKTITKSRENARNPYYDTPYIEAQVPGGFNISEIEKILFNPDRMGFRFREPGAIEEAVKQLESALSDAGLGHIPIEVLPGYKAVEGLVAKYGTHAHDIAKSGAIPIPKKIKGSRQSFDISKMSDKQYEKLVSTIFNKKETQSGDYLIPEYQIGKRDKSFAFQGLHDVMTKQLPQEFDALLKSGTSVVPANLEGLLQEAIKLKPFNIKNRVLLYMLQKNKIKNSKSIISLIDDLGASTNINRYGKALQTEDADGFAMMLAALTGNKAARKIINFKKPSVYEAIRNNLLKNQERQADFMSEYDYGEPINPRDVPVFHMTKHDVKRNKKGDFEAYPAGFYDRRTGRASVHTTLFSPVSTQPGHFGGDWSGVHTIFIDSLESMIKNNSVPHLMNTFDTAFTANPGQSILFKNPAAIHQTKNAATYASILIQKGLLKKGQQAPPIAFDPKNKDVFQLIKDEYTDADRKFIIKLVEDIDKENKTPLSVWVSDAVKKNFKDDSTFPSGPKFAETEVLSEIATQIAKTYKKFFSEPDYLGSNGLGYGTENMVSALRKQLKNFPGLHDDSTLRFSESLEFLGSLKKFHNTGKLMGMDSLQAFRQAILGGFFNTRTKYIDPDHFANGGYVMPKFAMGGYAMGTDTVPAMLTPGEFVIKKSAVDRIGPSTLNKINGYANGGLVGGSSTSVGDSVYNYSVNVNVSSGADPNQIARAVMTQIKQIDNHRVRGSAF